jgi:hypothetical protein
MYHIQNNCLFLPSSCLYGCFIVGYLLPKSYKTLKNIATLNIVSESKPIR